LKGLPLKNLISHFLDKHEKAFLDDIFDFLFIGLSWNKLRGQRG